MDDVTTRQTRQKVSRNMFLPGAYKRLPGFSSPWPDAVTAALQHANRNKNNTHTHTHCTYRCTFALMHAVAHTYMHVYAHSHACVNADHRGKDAHKPHTCLNKHFHVHTLMHTLSLSHTQTHNLITSVEAGMGF